MLDGDIRSCSGVPDNRISSATNQCETLSKSRLPLLERLAGDHDDAELQTSTPGSLSPRRAFFSGLAGLTPAAPFRDDLNHPRSTAANMTPRDRKKDKNENESDLERNVEGTAETAADVEGELSGRGDPTLTMRGEPMTAAREGQSQGPEAGE